MQKSPSPISPALCNSDSRMLSVSRGSVRVEHRTHEEGSEERTTFQTQLNRMTNPTIPSCLQCQHSYLTPRTRGRFEANLAGSPATPDLSRPEGPLPLDVHPFAPHRSENLKSPGDTASTRGDIFSDFLLDVFLAAIRNFCGARTSATDRLAT
eukprot:760921-Hanusia_phi.AAC.2